ncbi:MAG TPA: Ig-like domain-containing protein, partial [Thermoanaerobaculia bacterium]|nr:Ig-like domain-containing protein [Thermoanaerobaculia bacterium]
PNVWYRFRVVVDAQSRETSIRARFWRDGTEEPAGDSIIATDADSKRLIAGRIGVWSAVGGGAYVDDLIARSSQPSGPIDSKPPTIAFYESGTRIDPSSSPTFVRDVAIEIRVEDESPFTVTSILDGSPYTSLATIATEGTHSLHVIAVDAYGNRSEATLTFTIRRATSGPAIAFTSPSASQILGVAHIIATGTFDNAASVSVNGIAAEIDTTARTFTVPLDLLEGPNTLTAVATDAAGNTATASLSLVVDTRAPELSVTSPAANACIDATSIEVRGRAIDPALKSVKVMSLDATVAADGTWSVIVPAPNELTYTMTIEATDTLGHSTVSVAAVTIDRTPPQIEVTESGLPFDGAITNRTLSLLTRVTDADARTSMTATLDGAAYTAGTPVSTEGDHELKLVAADCAGHIAQKVVRFTIDRTPPQLISIAPQTGATIGSRSAITGTASPDTASITIDPPGLNAMVANGTFSVTDVPLAEGANALTITLVDRAGNTSQTPYTITLQSIAPQVEIAENGSAISSGALFNRSVTPVLRSSDPSATIAGTLNGAPFTSGTAIATDGSYTLVATVTDSVGHSSQATVTFTIDTTPPQVKIVAPVSGSTFTSDTVEVRGTASPDAMFVSVNGINAPVSNGAFVITITLDTGPNDIAAIARDRAGNVASDRVDLVRTAGPRGLILTSPPDQMITNRTTTIVAGQVLTASTDAKVMIAGAEVPVDASGAFRKTDLALAEGENIIVASVQTPSGETNQVSVRVIADRTPPRVRLLESGQPLADSAHFPDRAIITADATDNNQPITPQLTVDGAAVSQPLTITAAGGHTIIAVARDVAGNETRVERTIFVGAGASGCALESFDPPTGSVVTSNTITVAGRSGGAAAVKINGNAAFVANGSFCGTVELPNEGENSVSIVCTDASGNATGTPVTLVLRRATGEPSVTITAPAEGAVVGTDVISVAGTVGDGVTSVDVNGAAATISGTSFSATGVRLAGGLNIVVAHARNAAGRATAASRRITYLKDAPALAITSPATSLSTGASRIDVTGAWSNLDPSTIAIAGATVQTTSLSDTDGTFVARDVSLTAGQQTLTVTARDVLGRSASASIQVTLVVSSPSISITTPSDNALFAATAPATFTVSGTFTGAPGATVDVGGVAATINGSSFSADVPFSTQPSGITPVIARVTEPSGSASIDTIRVQKIGVAPRIVDAFPAASAIEIDPGALPLVLFSSPMDRAAVASAFRLETSAGALITGTLRLDREVLTFAPAALLSSGGSYTIRVTATARDIAGNALASEYTSSFTIASSAPSTPPAVTPISAGVCAQQQEIHGTAPAGSRLRLDYGAISLSTTANGTGAFTFQLPLSGQSGCQIARVRTVGSDGSLSPATEVRFQVDCNGPQVVGATFDRATNRLSITFSKAMNASTLTVGQSGTVLLQLDDGHFSTGTATVQANTATVVPSEDLAQKSFTLSVTTNAEDTTGAKLSFAFTQAFNFDSNQPPSSNNGLGFISGEVFDGNTGRPLAGATVTIDIPSQPAITATTDARGRYAAQLPEGAHTIRVSASGYITVWRQIIVAAGSGVIPIDVRLARRSTSQAVSSGDLVVSNGASGLIGLAPVELRIPTGVVPSGKTVTVTSLGAQSLPGLLPLAWSPLGCAVIETDATTLAGAQLTFTVAAAEITSAAQTIVAAQYHDDRDEWQILTPTVNVGSDGKATLPISAAGTYALVYADRAPGLVSPPPPITGATLQGVVDPCATGTCPALTAQSFVIDPPVVLPTGRSVATLKIVGSPPAIFPSGTAVQAYVDEELQLADGSRISDPPFAIDLLLYRNLAGDAGVAQLQLAPSSKAAEVVLRVGFENIRILPYPGRVDRGTLIGPEGGRVPGDGRVAIDVPAGSASEALKATSTTITDFGAFGSIAGFNIVGGFTLSLQRANNATSSTPQLLTPARVTFSGVNASAQNILVEVIDATPYGRIYRLAAQMVPLEGGRLTTKGIDRSVIPLDGVIHDGRYLLLAANTPIAFATGSVRVPAAAFVGDARVLTPLLGVSDITRAGGIFSLPV